MNLIDSFPLYTITLSHAKNVNNVVQINCQKETNKKTEIRFLKPFVIWKSDHLSQETSKIVLNDEYVKSKIQDTKI